MLNITNLFSYVFMDLLFVQESTAKKSTTEVASAAVREIVCSYICRVTSSGRPSNEETKFTNYHEHGKGTCFRW